MDYDIIENNVLGVKNLPFDVGQYSFVQNPHHIGCWINIPFSSSFVGQTNLPVGVKFESKFKSVHSSKNVSTPSTMGKRNKR